MTSDKQSKLIKFITDPETTAKAVEGSMQKRLDKMSNQTGLREKLSIYMTMYAQNYEERHLIGMQDAITQIESLFTLELQKIKAEMEKEKKELQLATDTPRELLPSEQEIKLNKNHQAIGYNQAISKAIELIDRRIRG